LKIADFGSVREMAEKEITKKVGTIIYMAPEVFDNASYTIACDVYSFGIILCEMFTRQRPYAAIHESINQNRANFESDIRRIESPLRPECPASVPTTISAIIQKSVLPSL
jgi:serine/threonine protein kinase